MKRIVTVSKIIVLLAIGWLVLSSSVLAVPLSTNVLAQLVEPFYMGYVAVSPRDPYVVYVVQRRIGTDAHVPHAPSPFDGTEIWLGNAARGIGRPLAAKPGGNWAPSWSPDGKMLAFYSARDGTPRLYTLDVASGVTTARQPIVALFADIPPLWASDGRHLLVPVQIRDASSRRSVPKPHVSFANSMEVFSDIGAASHTHINSGLMPPYDEGTIALDFIDAHDGSAREIVRGNNLYSYTPSRDWHKLLVSFNTAGEAGTYMQHYRIELVDIASRRSTTLQRDASNYAGYAPTFSWSPNDRTVAYETMRAEYRASGEQLQTTLHILDTHVGREIATIDDFGPKGAFLSKEQPKWTAGGDLIFSTNDGFELISQRGTVRKPIHLSGISNPIPVSIADGVTLAGGPSDGIFLVRSNATMQEGPILVRLGDGTILKRHLTNQDVYGSGSFALPAVVTRDARWIVYPRQRSDIASAYVAEPITFGAQRQLGDLNPQLDGITFGKSRLLTYKDKDGRALRAALLLPAGYVLGRRYPMATWIYGFANGSDEVNDFGLIAFNAQMLATRGFAVLWPDAPLRVGSPSADLAAMVLPGVDAAIAAGVADSHKVTVFGQSGGGGSTLQIITETNRFAAAATANGAGEDLFSFFGQLDDDGDAPNVRWLVSLNGGMGGDPWKYQNRYLRNSPFQRLDHIHTPLLLLEGTADPGVRPDQPDEIFVGLRYLGRPVEYVRYLGEGHVASEYTPEHYADWWNRIIAWFRMYTHTP